MRPRRIGADAARHRRPGARHRHGGRRQRADLRAHPRGGARRQDADRRASTPASPAPSSPSPTPSSPRLPARWSCSGWGPGPIRGFAVTLTIGICTSIFASVTVVRLLIYYWLNSKQAPAAPSSCRSRTRRAMRFIPNFKGFDFFPHDLRLPFMRYKGLCFALSIVAMALSLAVHRRQGLQLRRRLQGRLDARGAVELGPGRHRGAARRSSASWRSAPCRSRASARPATC